MAKPINLYQGPAPAAMGMMGQGILEAGANIGRTIQSGYEAMGKGLAGGISSAASSIAGAYTQSKDDQAKFDATKKLFNAFESYLPKQKDLETGKEFSPIGNQIRAIFNDTTMSVREKNAMAPTLLSFLANAQQQYGRESVANIMNAGRVEAAGARRPGPVAGTSFGGVPTVDQLLNSSVGQPQANDGSYALPTNPSQGNPGALISNAPYAQESGTRVDPNTGMTQFWDPKVKRWIDEELYFNPQTLGLERPPQ